MNWPRLRCAVRDAKAIAALLRDLYAFPEENITTLYDGAVDSRSILKTLYGYRKLAADESLLIYYAGHGYLDLDTGKGYWVPADAHLDSPWEYLSCTQLVDDHIQAPRVRHVVMLIDSCFAGAFLRGELPKYHEGAFRFRSRWAITSGGLDPVQDAGAGGHSLFNFKLQQYLRGEVPGAKPVFTETELFATIAPMVAEFSANELRPEIGKLNDPKHAGGHFVFCRVGEPEPLGARPETAPERDGASGPVPEPMEAVGTVAVVSRVDGVVTLDGQVMGNVTPGPPILLRQVRAGLHSLRVEAPDGRAWEHVVDVPAGEAVQLEAREMETGEAADGLTPGGTECPTPGGPWEIPGMGMAFVWLDALGCWVGKYEVTNEEFRQFRNGHRSGGWARGRGKGTGSEVHSLDGKRQPVVAVSYVDAAAFANWLTRRERRHGRLRGDWQYRLPTAQEWAAYARCGGNREFPWGNEWPPARGNYGEITGYADGFAVTCPVEDSGCNEWGLYGVGGNVWEWTTEGSESRRAARGGSWYYSYRYSLQHRYRLFGHVTSRSSFSLGFRLVLRREQPGAQANGL